MAVYQPSNVATFADLGCVIGNTLTPYFARAVANTSPKIHRSPTDRHQVAQEQPDQPGTVFQVCRSHLGSGHQVSLRFDDTDSACAS